MPRWRRISARPMRCASASGRSSASRRRTCAGSWSGAGRAYDSVRDLWLRSGLSSAALERLADADAFRSLGLDRRQALWAVRGLDRVGDQDDLPLFAEPPGARNRAGRAIAADAARRACGRGLPAPVAVLEGASDVVHARAPRRARNPALRRAAGRSGTASGSPSPAWCWCVSGRAPPRASSS